MKQNFSFILFGLFALIAQPLSALREEAQFDLSVTVEVKPQLALQLVQDNLNLGTVDYFTGVAHNNDPKLDIKVEGHLLKNDSVSIYLKDSQQQSVQNGQKISIASTFTSNVVADNTQDNSIFRIIEDQNTHLRQFEKNFQLQFQGLEVDQEAFNNNNMDNMVNHNQVDFKAAYTIVAETRL